MPGAQGRTPLLTTVILTRRGSKTNVQPQLVIIAGTNLIPKLSLISFKFDSRCEEVCGGKNHVKRSLKLQHKLIKNHTFDHGCTVSAPKREDRNKHKAYEGWWTTLQLQAILQSTC